MSCTNNAALLLSNDGSMYSWGVDELQTGVLGLGENQIEAIRPIPNKSLFDYKIVSISHCINHASATDSKG